MVFASRARLLAGGTHRYDFEGDPRRRHTQSDLPARRGRQVCGKRATCEKWLQDAVSAAIRRPLRSGSRASNGYPGRATGASSQSTAPRACFRSLAEDVGIGDARLAQAGLAHAAPCSTAREDGKIEGARGWTSEEMRRRAPAPRSDAVETYGRAFTKSRLGRKLPTARATCRAIPNRGPATTRCARSWRGRCRRALRRTHRQAAAGSMREPSRAQAELGAGARRLDAALA